MNIKVLELVLVVVAALGIGFWQLYDVNTELKKDRERDSGRDSDDDSDDDQDAGRSAR
jgi:hypothetical protein